MRDRQLPGRLGGHDARGDAARAVRADHHRGLAAVLLGGRARQDPMRYSGGLLGGSWLTALTSDMGGGKFDGAWLVQNFESLNPANTLLDQTVQSLFQDR